jgi:uncharacterized membrane protein
LRRRPHLDWLRGIAVLIMIQGHTIDSWTRVADRTSSAYQWSSVIAGFGAPAFLFLAGTSMLLAAGGRRRRGLTVEEVTRSAFRHGLFIFALAFLFRLQSIIISGAPLQSLLRVDILNIMGISMMAGALSLPLVLSGAERAASTVARPVVLFVGFTIAAAMLTPIIRATPLLDWLPDAVEAYVRPKPGRTNFTLFPWAAFFSAGCAVGALLVARPDDSRRINAGLAAVGLAMAVGGYAASFLPQVYPEVSFWTSSPTFFFLRLGILTLAVPAAYALNQLWRAGALLEFGQASLFVYWVHVELVYGVPSAPLHQRLSFPAALVALPAFALAMFALVQLKNRLQRGRPTETGRHVPGNSI